jgi:hypothetical protein
MTKEPLELVEELRDRAKRTGALAATGNAGFRSANNLRRESHQWSAAADLIEQQAQTINRLQGQVGAAIQLDRIKAQTIEGLRAALAITAAAYHREVPHHAGTFASCEWPTCMEARAALSTNKHQEGD